MVGVFAVTFNTAFGGGIIDDARRKNKNGACFRMRHFFIACSEG
jgi:hypothetical protein